MPKQKLPPLADWEVAFRAGAAFPVGPLTIRATRLRTRDGGHALEDTYGNELFAASADVVLYVRRTEPGEDVPAAKEAPKEGAKRDVPLPDSLKNLTASQARDLQDFLHQHGVLGLMLPPGSKVLPPGPAEDVALPDPESPAAEKVAPRRKRSGAHS